MRCLRSQWGWVGRGLRLKREAMNAHAMNVTLANEQACTHSHSTQLYPGPPALSEPNGVGAARAVRTRRQHGKRNVEDGGRRADDAPPGRAQAVGDSHAPHAHRRRTLCHSSKGTYWYRGLRVGGGCAAAVAATARVGSLAMVAAGCLDVVAAEVAVARAGPRSSRRIASRTMMSPTEHDRSDIRAVGLSVTSAPSGSPVRRVRCKGRTSSGDPYCQLR